MELLIPLAFVAIVATASYHLAKNRGYDPATWAMIAVVCPLSIVVLACLTDRNFDAKLEKALAETNLLG